MDGERAERLLRNLLAVIHRDDGSHTEKRGLEASAKDAHEAISAMRIEIDRLHVRLGLDNDEIGF